MKPNALVCLHRARTWQPLCGMRLGSMRPRGWRMAGVLCAFMVATRSRAQVEYLAMEIVNHLPPEQAAACVSTLLNPCAGVPGRADGSRPLAGVSGTVPPYHHSVVEVRATESSDRLQAGVLRSVRVSVRLSLDIRGLCMSSASRCKTRRAALAIGVLPSCLAFSWAQASKLLRNMQAKEKAVQDASMYRLLRSSTSCDRFSRTVFRAACKVMTWSGFVCDGSNEVWPVVSRPCTLHSSHLMGSRRTSYAPVARHDIGLCMKAERCATVGGPQKEEASELIAPRPDAIPHRTGAASIGGGGGGDGAVDEDTQGSPEGHDAQHGRATTTTAPPRSQRRLAAYTSATQGECRAIV